VFEAGAVREPSPPESATADGGDPVRLAPARAEESSPGRQPWVEGPSARLRHPSPAGAGGGAGARVGAPTHGSRRGLPSGAPAGAVEASQQNSQPMGPYVCGKYTKSWERSQELIENKRSRQSNVRKTNGFLRTKRVKRSEKAGVSMQRRAVGGQNSAPGRRGDGAGAVLYGPGRVDTRTPREETDIMTESPLGFHNSKRRLCRLSVHA